MYHPISYFQAVVLGITQGIAEPFPISSLGHGVVLPRLFGWNIHQNDKFFLTFLVATHLGTALVLLGFFFGDWVRIVKGLWRSLAMREIRDDDVDARLGWLLIAATIPVGIIGLLLRALAAQTVRLAPDRCRLPDRQRHRAAAVRAAAPAPAAARATGSATATRGSPNSAGARRSASASRRWRR